MRIYVACLASYNAGTLHGRWIDATQGVEHIREKVAEMLRASPEPNVMVPCPACRPEGSYSSFDKTPECATCSGKGEVPSAEEFAIHGYEDFGPWRIGEYESLETVASVAEAAEESGEPEAFLTWLSDDSTRESKDAADMVNAFRDDYCGVWRSEVEYAEHLVDDMGALDGAGDWAKMYFDYEAFARDLFINDYSSVDAPGGVYVFRRN